MGAEAYRVLVTGATGFLARWAVKDLVAQGLEVHAVGSGRSSPPSECDGARWHRADLLQPGEIGTLVATVRPTHLLHFAWVVTPGRSYTDPLNFAWVECSLRLLRKFREGGGVRSLLVGSCAEYDTPSDSPCDEQTTPLVLARQEPGLPYAICKASLGRMSAAYAAQEGFSHAWARIFFQFGPYENRNRLIPYAITSLIAGREARCSVGTQIRSFMYAPDVGAACAALLCSPVEGYVNIGSDEKITIAQILSAIGMKLGRPELLQLGAIPLSPFDPPYLLPNTTRLSQEVGWLPKTSLDTALDETIAWWRDRADTY